MTRLITLVLWPLRLLLPSEDRLDLAHDRWQLGMTLRAQNSDVG